MRIAFPLLLLTACAATTPREPILRSAPLEAASLGDVEPLDSARLGPFASWVSQQRHATWILVLPYWAPAFALVIREVEPAHAMERRMHAIDLYSCPKSQHDEGTTRPIEKWDRTTITMDPDAASALNRTMESTVRRARYPKPDIRIDEHGNRIESVSGMADGVAYYFGTFRFRGRAVSPRAGFSRELVDLTHRLRDAVSAPEEQRASLFAACLAFADDLRSRVEAAPW